MNKTASILGVYGGMFTSGMRVSSNYYELIKMLHQDYTWNVISADSNLITTQCGVTRRERYLTELNSTVIYILFYTYTPKSHLIF